MLEANRTAAGFWQAHGFAGATIAGEAFLSSTSRSIAPAARWISPHISESDAAATATYTAYIRNWLSCPPLISPRRTECAPTQSTQVTPPKASGDGGGQHCPNACAADGRTEGIDGLAEAWCACASSSVNACTV